jgi:hypothetical protein
MTNKNAHINSLMQSKEAKTLCKAKISNGTKCTRRASICGYCMLHFVSHDYKENKKLSINRKALREEINAKKINNKLNSLNNSNSNYVAYIN